MRIGVTTTVALSCLALTGCGAVGAPPSGGAAAAAACPSFGEVDLARLPRDSRREPPSAADDHWELRAEVGAPAPPDSGVRQVRVWISGGHHGLVERSLIAVDREGAWSVTSVTRVRGPGDSVDGRQSSRTLSREEAAQLEQLLGGRCLAREPRQIPYVVRSRQGGREIVCSVGAVGFTLETYGVSLWGLNARRASFRQACTTHGASGAVVELLSRSPAP